MLKKIFAVIRVLFGTAWKKYPMFFAAETLRMLANVSQPFVGIFISPLIIDELIGDRDLKKIFIYTGTLIIGEFLLTVIADRCGTVIGKYHQRLNNYFSILIGKHSMELDFQLTEDKAALEQIERARTGMDWYSGGVVGIADQVFPFVGNIIKIVGLVAVIVTKAPLLIAVIVVYVIISTLMTVRKNKIEVEAFGKLSKVNRLFGYFGWNVVDPKYGKEIRLYEARDTMVDYWKDNTEKSNTHWKNQADGQFPYVMAEDILSFFREVFTVFYVALLAVNGVYTAGIFTQMVAAEGNLSNSLRNIMWNVTELVKRCNYAYEYVKFMEYPAALEKGDVKVEKKPHEIEFRHVTFAYPGTDRKILEDVNIRIAPGEHLSIVGLNGAGKTTFIKLLCRLYDPTEGEILMDGRNIKEYDYSDYMAQFAPVFQDYKLFALSVKDNITFGKDDEDLDGLFEKVGLSDFVKKLDKGTDTNIFKFFDEEGVEPSGGEQQKIAIARALHKDAPIVILDEPTAALDPVAEYDIYRQFNTLVGGRSAFYISHRLSSCRFCDRIAVFSEGRIAEYGTHDTLVDAGGLYAEMFEAQAKYYR
jgi:ABC-type multidrug transport system fused ATPase/permease subunit